jgi:DNA-binding CsgD family transcriptional regulator
VGDRDPQLSARESDPTPDLARRVLSLLELLHGAPGSARAWTRFLDALRDAISPAAVTLFVAQANEIGPGLLAGSGLGVRALQLDDVLRPSVRHPNAAQLPTGALYDLPPAAFEKTVLYRDVLAPAGIRAGPGLVVVNDRNDQQVLAATLVLPRGRGWAPRTSDRALLQRLAPHMAIARRLHARLAERQRETEALLAAFDHLVLGVVLLTAEGGVSYVNRSAAESLGVAPGFEEAPAAGGDRTLAWQRLVGTGRDWSRGAFVLQHPADGRSLQFLAAPFGWSGRGGPLGRRFARAVFIGDPKRRTGDPIGVFNEIYGLTPGETRLTLLLLADCSLDEAARLLGISRSTARSVLKRVFQKTGTKRQSGLVRLMFTGFAQVRPDDAASPAPLRAGSRP